MHPLRLTTLVFPLLAALVSRAVDLPAGGQDLSGATPVKGYAQPQHGKAEPVGTAGQIVALEEGFGWRSI